MYELTRSGLLARNTLLNLIGQCLPLLVALFAIPPLIRGLGVERFGVLALGWMVIGYFSLFDLGLGRAVTKLVAEKLGDEKEEETPALVWTSLSLISILGLMGMLVLGFLSPVLVYDLLKIPEVLRHETLCSFYLLSVSIPFTVSTNGIGGVLAAKQRFDLINAVRIPLGAFTFLGPLLTLPLSRSLTAIIAVLLAGRIVAWFVHLAMCMKVMPALRKGIVFNRAVVRPLLRFGSWMTVSNIVGPIMVTMDRFFIGALVSASAVAYYATPYEIVTKLWIIPNAVIRVLFPAFATTLVQGRSRATMLFARGLKSVFLTLFPISLIIVTFAYDGLELWLGSEFARNSTRVLQWLCLGVFINSLGQIAFSLVQGAGRPDLTAKLHLVELPFYLLAMWFLIPALGVQGAAVAWTLRVTVDTALLFVLTRRLLPAQEALNRRLAYILVGAIVILGLSTLPRSLLGRGVFILTVLLGFSFVAWLFVLDPEERALAKRVSQGIHGAN